VRQDTAVILAEVAQFLSEDKEPPVDTKEAAIPGTAAPAGWSPMVQKGEFVVPLSDADKLLPLGYQCLKKSIIPIAHTLLIDTSQEVRTASTQALIKICKFLNSDDIGTVILTLVLNLAHDLRDEQRVTAVHLMDQLAHLFGFNLCANFVALELAAFADDSAFRVRKATAQSFGDVCRTVGSEFTVNRLLPHFIRLSRDLIWGVRKGCVECMVAVAAVCPDDVKRQVFIPMFERFRSDTSRWVRNGAYEILGPFLHTLGDKLVSPETLQLFTNIPQMTHSVVDADVNFHCAFNFPAVTQAMGPQRWPELVDCFNTLARDAKFPVRRTLASSLHVVAGIIGPELSHRHLVPVAHSLFNDLDEVKQTLVKNLAKFLLVLAPAHRQEFVPTLYKFLQDKDNWRPRIHITKQLDVLSLLFNADTTATQILAIAFALLKDHVYDVRKAAAASIGVMFRRLSASCPVQYSEARERIMELSRSQSYQDRQLFVRLGRGMFLYLDPAQWQREYLPALAALMNDPVANVRVLVASLGHDLHAHSFFRETKESVDINRILKADRDRDVGYYAHNCHAAHLASGIPVEPDEEVRTLEQQLRQADEVIRADQFGSGEGKERESEATDPADTIDSVMSPSSPAVSSLRLETDHLPRLTGHEDHSHLTAPTSSNSLSPDIEVGTEFSHSSVPQRVDTGRPQSRPGTARPRDRERFLDQIETGDSLLSSNSSEDMASENPAFVSSPGVEASTNSMEALSIHAMDLEDSY